MKIAIVGAGAIGCLFGACLQASGHSVILVNNNPLAVTAIRKNGVSVREPSGKIIRTRPKVELHLKSDDGPDLVLLTVKSYDTEAAGRSLEKVQGISDVLSIQNGLGNFETLSRFLPAQSILAGITTEAAFQAGYGEVLHTGKGVTRIGEFTGGPTKRCREIGHLIRSVGLDINISGNVEGVIWSKAIVNSAINPVTAIARVLNGEITRNSNLLEVALEVLKEGMKVASSRGVVPIPSPVSFFNNIVSISRKNQSSMLQDIENGKRTEIRELNGSISSAGRNEGIDTPYTSALGELVLGLETSTRRSKLGLGAIIRECRLGAK